MTTTRNLEKCQIIDGPSREELFDALRLRNEHRKVTFTVLQRGNQGNPSISGRQIRLLAAINEITAEDGSGHSWCLKVRIEASPEDGSVMSRHDVVDLYYRDERREGQIIDARRIAERPTIDRKGGIWSGGHLIARINDDGVVAV